MRQIAVSFVLGLFIALMAHGQSKTDPPKSSDAKARRATKAAAITPATDRRHSCDSAGPFAGRDAETEIVPRPRPFLEALSK